MRLLAAAIQRSVEGRCSMLRVAVVSIVGGVLCFAASAVPAETVPSATITVHLSNFAFSPAVLQMRAGVPISLHFVNDGSGGHNWSAPELFAAATFPNGTPPSGGRVELAPKQRLDLLFVPRVPGTYKVECTHFLHSLFGMSGRVVVDGPAR
jgi:plastocyanin